jgi:hypothetical protein
MPNSGITILEIIKPVKIIVMIARNRSRRVVAFLDAHVKWELGGCSRAGILHARHATPPARGDSHRIQRGTSEAAP